MLTMPECVVQGYAYMDENHKWQITPDAPQWAKDEFAEFIKLWNHKPKPDKNGIITLY